jgi:hypothetical protein
MIKEVVETEEWNPRYCYSCSVPHVENCEKCFGWGFTSKGKLVIASEVESVINGISCSFCGGNSKNIHIIIK